MRRSKGCSTVPAEGARKSNVYVCMNAYLRRARTEIQGGAHGRILSYQLAHSMLSLMSLLRWRLMIR
mgnify:CR=1 FL=1